MNTPFLDIDLSLADRRDGKVRVSYAYGSNQRLFVTTDRLSAFDRVIAGVPYKGQVLNQLSAWWFERTADVVDNHVIDLPDPNVLVARAAQPLPVEVIVRGYITGVTSTSLWRQYADGARTIYGYHFSDGLRKNTDLPAAIVTPTTKAENGSHDEPLSPSDVTRKGLVAAGLWRAVEAAALELFARGQELARQSGLILADTKYEFGTTPSGDLLLIDEIHTPDSSRYWVADSYEDRLSRDEEPESLDKEVVRRALIDAGYDGHGMPPTLEAAVWEATSRRYIDAYERLTGLTFQPGSYPVEDRIRRFSGMLPDQTPVNFTGRARYDSDAYGSDSPHEECGVFGVSTPHGEGVAQTVFFGLFALQHRGQEAAGIAVSDGSRVRLHKDTGLVTNVFTQATMNTLAGYHGIGHTRYSTTGANAQRNHQPFLVETMHGPLALAHNGNLVNAPALRDELLTRGFGLTATSDTEVMTLMLAAAGGKTWEDRVERTLPAWKGAYSLVILAADRVIAVRDPWGFRPMSVGRLPHGGYAVASETCALSTLGCLEISEVAPGEIVTLNGAEMTRRQALTPAARSARCTFEFVYFSRPDSVWADRNMHHVRQRLGEELAAEAPAAADVVIPVPDSSIPAAIGFSRASGIPHNDGLIKNRYIGRTFIEPTQDLRDRGVALKFNALAENLAGKRVVMIDDSLVRGTTAGPLVKLLREAGATEVHVRITCPPITHACHFGVDMGHDGDLMAAHLTVEEIRAHIDADSLAFLSLDGMMRAITIDPGDNKVNGDAEGYCNACFTGLA